MTKHQHERIEHEHTGEPWHVHEFAIDVERLARAMHGAYAEMRGGRVRWPSIRDYRAEAETIAAEYERVTDR
jgi:hypothetical protein